MPIPADYKETGVWIENKMSLSQLKSTTWWEVFQDPLLNQLEQGLSCNNNNLKLNLARYQEAMSLAKITASALYPDIEAIGSIAREKDSPSLVSSRGNSNGNPSSNSNGNQASSSTSTRNLIRNTFLISAALNYELDAWGRVRNSVIASDSQARASGYDLATIALSLHAELARDYFQLRGYDEAQKVLDNTVQAYGHSLFLTHKRHNGGLVAGRDVDEALSQYENARTTATANRLKRERLEHAIAVLIGEIPSNFRIQRQDKGFRLATLAPDMPSTLLERRPDVAAASERIRAANAEIGVARAAFFPQFNLFSLIGFESNRLSNLFTKPNLIWSLGPSTALSLIKPEIQQVIFNGFKRVGQLCYAKASYLEAVNMYRQSVLDAFREVEDSLSSIHRLDQELVSQRRAAAAAKRALYQANQQYKGGLVTYINVVVYENLALQSELALVDIRTRRQLASVQLIKALGGGWAPC